MTGEQGEHALMLLLSVLGVVAPLLALRLAVLLVRARRQRDVAVMVALRLAFLPQHIAASAPTGPSSEEIRRLIGRIEDYANTGEDWT